MKARRGEPAGEGLEPLGGQRVADAGEKIGKRDLVPVRERAELGAKIVGSSITAGSTGTANALLSVEASGVTAFAEGQVILEIWIQNIDS